MHLLSSLQHTRACLRHKARAARIDMAIVVDVALHDGGLVLTAASSSPKFLAWQPRPISQQVIGIPPRPIGSPRLHSIASPNAIMCHVVPRLLRGTHVTSILHAN